MAGLVRWITTASPSYRSSLLNHRGVFQILKKEARTRSYFQGT